MSEKKGKELEVDDSMDNIDSIISISIPSSEVPSDTEKPIDVQLKIYGKRLVLTFSSFFAGLVMIIFGGQQIGWNVMNTQLLKRAHSYHEIFFTFRIIFPIIWFVLAIVGSLASRLFQQLHKQTIYFVALGSASLNAIMLIFVPSDQVFTLFASEVFGAFGFGLAYTFVLVHAAEMASPKLRGFIVTSVHFCLVLGFLTSPMTYKLVDNDIHENTLRNAGIRKAILLLTGLVINAIFTKESPLFLIKSSKESEARDVLQWLEFGSDQKIQTTLEESKKLLDEDTNHSNVKQCFFSFIMLLLFKLVFCSSFNIVLHEMLLVGSDPSSHGMTLILSRFCGLIVVCFTIDAKRKLHFLAIVCCGLSLLALSCFRSIPIQIEWVSSWGIIFEFFAGLGVGFIFDLYATESLNVHSRITQISVVNALEFGAQMALLYIDKFNFELNANLTAVFERSSAIILIVLGLVFYIFVKETARLTLKQTRDLYK